MCFWYIQKSYVLDISGVYNQKLFGPHRFLFSMLFICLLIFPIHEVVYLSFLLIHGWCYIFCLPCYLIHKVGYLILSDQICIQLCFVSSALYMNDIMYLIISCFCILSVIYLVLSAILFSGKRPLLIFYSFGYVLGPVWFFLNHVVVFFISAPFIRDVLHCSPLLFLIMSWGKWSSLLVIYKIIAGHRCCFIDEVKYSVLADFI